MKTKEYMREYSAKFRAEHPEKNREHQRKWREANRDKLNSSVAAWALLNKDRIKDANAARYQRDRDRIRARISAYTKANPEGSRARMHKRRAAKTQAGGAYTSAQWMTLCNKYGNVCLCCEKSAQLTPDHVIPIAKGGTSNIDNIQPLCMPCNAKKSTATTDFRHKFDLNTTEGGLASKAKILDIP